MAQVTDEHIERLKMHFVSTEVSLSQLSRISKTVCGINVSLDMLKKYSSLGTSWVSLRDIYKNSNDKQKDTGSQIFQLKDAIFNQIITSTVSGLMVYGVDIDRVKELVESEFPEAQVMKISPSGIDSALVNAYMTLIQKGNIAIEGTSSGKTSKQAALEMIRDQLSKANG